METEGRRGEGQQAVGVCWYPVFWKDADELSHVQVYTVNVLFLPMVVLWWLLAIIQLVCIVAAALFILCSRAQQTNTANSRK